MKSLNNDVLMEKISKAKSTEETGSYFSAAILYKDALDAALRLQDGKAIKLCKTKLVEMNRKSIESGKDFKEHEFTHPLSEEQNDSLNAFITEILKIEDTNLLLKTIGQHPDLRPKVKDVEELSKKVDATNLSNCNS